MFWGEDPVTVFTLDNVVVVEPLDTLGILFSPVFTVQIYCREVIFTVIFTVLDSFPVTILFSNFVIFLNIENFDRLNNFHRLSLFNSFDGFKKIASDNFNFIVGLQGEGGEGKRGRWRETLHIGRRNCWRGEVLRGKVAPEQLLLWRFILTITNLKI